MFFLLLVVALGAYAQTTDGSLGGVVRDESGGVIAGAKVLAKNNLTGVEATQTCNQSGVFLFPSLSTGAYRLSVENPGFRSTVIERVVLDIGAKVNLEIGLRVATAASSVEVVETDPRVDIAYATASVGGVVEGKRVLELPVINRDALVLATTQAGSFGSYYSGARIGTLNTQVDGINIQDARINQGRSSPFFLSVDRIESFRVVTSPADAELGRGSGQIQMLTRSGTNELHGSIFEYHRNTVLNANTFFNNLQGSDRDGRPLAPRNFLIRNQYGARAGGPVVLPGIYNGKNRTFSHVLFEGQRVRQKTRVTRTVLTDTARQGLFCFWTGAQNANAAAPNPAVDFQGNPVRPNNAGNCAQ
jgi:hypothetical protein